MGQRDSLLFYQTYNDLLPLLDHNNIYWFGLGGSDQAQHKALCMRKTVAQIKDEQPPINKKYAPWISRFRAVADEIIDTGTGLSRPGGQEASY